MRSVKCLLNIEITAAFRGAPPETGKVFEMSEKAGKNRGDYKRVNRGLVLKMIATGQCSTRIELARGTGLSKMAISNIVSEMLQQNLLIETEADWNGEMGRNPIRLAISPLAPKVAGLLILRDRCEAVLCDLNLNILKRERINMDNMSAQRLTEIVFELLDTVLFGEENIIAIGLASVGPISVQRGMILKPFFFYGIENVKIVEIIQSRYHLPVYFDHDNQSAALVETLYGNGRGFQDILFIGISEGVGCGVISDGQLYCNRRGLPPEMGHVSIDINGKPCQCGNRGCVETYLRTPEMLKKLRYHTRKFYTYEAFCKMEGDPIVESIFKEAVDDLASAAVSTVNILNSELILLGHNSVFWSDRHLTALEDQINQRLFVKCDERVKVKRAYFMQDAQLFGAAGNAIHQIFAGNLVIERE